MNLTWWEYEELIEHFHSRPDIWKANDNLFSCAVGVEVDSTLFIRLRLPSDLTSPFRIYHLIADCQEWSADVTSAYVVEFVNAWTSHSRRTAIESFLHESLKIDLNVATLAAIAIESFDWSSSRLEAPTPPSVRITPSLFPEFVVPGHSVASDPLDIGTFLFSSGSGWLRLRRTHGMLRTSLSLRGKNGDTHLLDGFVRPRDMSVEEFSSSMLTRGDEA